MPLPSRAAEQSISHARLLELVIYNPGIGTFISRTKRRKHLAGRVMGVLHHTGYVYVGVEGIDYTAGRLAWFYMTGEWPPVLVDHRDRDRSNNCWDNLRLATDSQNRMNSGKAFSNKAGEKGIYLRERNGWKPVWVAQIAVDGRVTHLGHFKTREAASEAYKAAAVKYYGEFAGVG